MARVLLIVRGPLKAQAGSDIEVVHNPKVSSVVHSADMPSDLNPDELLITPPGQTKVVKLKDYKESEGI